MTALNLALRFALELATLGALGYWGFRVADTLLLQIMLAIAVPLAVAALWGTWIAPKAPRRLRDPTKLALEMLVFSAGAAALLATGLTFWALCFAVLVVMNLALMFAFRQREH